MGFDDGLGFSLPGTRDRDLSHKSRCDGGVRNLANEACLLPQSDCSVSALLC
jgi:hypothetical protein